MLGFGPGLLPTTNDLDPPLIVKVQRLQSNTFIGLDVPRGHFKPHASG
jgi:hypothetical protein